MEQRALQNVRVLLASRRFLHRDSPKFIFLQSHIGLRTALAVGIRAMVLVTNVLDRLSKFRPAREGNIAVIFSIALIPIIGAIGIAVDWSMANKVQASIQKALDAAVLVGV